ncbi:major facilitator superfamily domain-containing protein 8 isoform X3 [Phycodurus eques]|uniref:major facilitator superfamily domain-containing protein 8 isoform X3 n=1 Tax=Phycodurus eques TaxID=693459 RepID=UPI002ACE4BF6|nr:major facilitator superfamily domain-containing protein 8 isoform X3 [Phycodurus eques]
MNTYGEEMDSRMHPWKPKERKRRKKKKKEKENTETDGPQQSNKEENLAVGDKLRDSEGGGTEVGAEVGMEAAAEVGMEAAAEVGMEAAAEVGMEVGSRGESDSRDVKELDLTSCFMRNASQIVQRKLKQKPKKENGSKKPLGKEQLPKKSDKDIGKEVSAGKHANIKISYALADGGNKCANSGHFQLAVDYFTRAIQYNPTDVKLFVNRAFCLEKLQEYEKALADAELCLGMRPGWNIGLFRKGRALAGLKRYQESIQAFQEILKMDGSCAEATQEIMRTQIKQLMAYGFTQEQSSNALNIHGTVQKAHEELSRLNPRIAPQGPAAPKIPAKTRPLVTPSLQTQEDHPLELFPVWVGNLTPAVTEQLLFNLFSRVGSLHSVKLLVNRRCAFVNFTRQECCDEAIRLFHALFVEPSPPEA